MLPFSRDVGDEVDVQYMVYVLRSSTSLWVAT